jgi:hypothetical protein
MGEPKYTVDQVTRALKNSRGLVSPAARALGCSAQTVRNYVKRHPTVAQAKEDEREKLIDTAEAHLYQQIINGNIVAILFTLKTVGKSRGYVERAELTGVDGAPIQVIQVGSTNGNSDTDEGAVSWP